MGNGVSTLYSSIVIIVVETFVMHFDCLWPFGGSQQRRHVDLLRNRRTAKQYEGLSLSDIREVAEV